MSIARRPDWLVSQTSLTAPVYVTVNRLTRVLMSQAFSDRRVWTGLGALTTLRTESGSASVRSVGAAASRRSRPMEPASNQAATSGGWPANPWTVRAPLPTVVQQRQPEAGIRSDVPGAHRTPDARSPNSTPAPTVLGQQEIRRVADQVMHSLDRRLMAYRERRGRV